MNTIAELNAEMARANREQEGSCNARINLYNRQDRASYCTRDPHDGHSHYNVYCLWDDRQVGEDHNMLPRSAWPKEEG